jgi:hypothetical protein
MTRYVVFFRALSDAQRDELNAGGWSSPIGMAYADAEPVGERLPKYDGAIEFDLFELAATVRDCEDKDELWDRMQNRGPNWTCEVTVRAFTDFPRSMSKGDVVYDLDGGEWTYVASFGFEPVTDEAFVAHLRGKLVERGMLPGADRDARGMARN